MRQEIGARRARAGRPRDEEWLVGRFAAGDPVGVEKAGHVNGAWRSGAFLTRRTPQTFPFFY